MQLPARPAGQGAIVRVECAAGVCEVDVRQGHAVQLGRQSAARYPGAAVAASGKGRTFVVLAFYNHDGAEAGPPMPSPSIDIADGAAGAAAGTAGAAATGAVGPPPKR